MRAFTHGQKPTQQLKSAGSNARNRAGAAQTHAAPSILTGSRFRYDLSRVPMHSTVTKSVAARAALDSAAGAEGAPLPARLRARLELTAGEDLSAVRIHTGARSARAAEAVDASAYTTGLHIHFGAGQFNPGCGEGQRLIAHEVAHALQQGNRLWRVQGGFTGISDGQDAQEVDADRFADAFSIGARHSVLPLVGGGDGVVARRPSRGTHHRRSLRRSQNTTVTAPRPSWETSSVVLNAVRDIVNEFVEEKDGYAYDKKFPSQHPEVPAEYRSLLEEWYFITHGASAQNRPGKPQLFIRGAMLSTHIDGAMAATMPFINELLKEGEPESTKSFLDDIFNRVDAFRQRALEEDVDDAIAAGAKAEPQTARTDLEQATEEEKLKAVLPEALEIVARANLVVNEFLHEHVEGTVQRAELEELFEKIRKQALQAGETESTTVLRPVMRLDLPASLVFLHAALDGVAGILTVSDPEERRKLFVRKMHWRGEAARVTNVVKLLEQFVGGAVAITGAATYALAKVTGNAKLATEVLAKGIPNIENVVTALNILGVIHGALVLVDKDASGEDRASAALELGVGGIGVAGRFGPAALGEAAGPLSTALVVNFYAIKWLGNAAAGAAVGFIKSGLTAVYEDMKKTALGVQWTALRLASAAQLESVETDVARMRELRASAEGLRWNLIDFLIKPYLIRATVRGSRRNIYGVVAYNDPASWSNELIGRFQPLVGRKGETVEQALSLAADFLQIVAKCFADQEYILQKTVDESVAE